MYDLIIIGGGAAGFFTAINTAENRPDFKHTASLSKQNPMVVYFPLLILQKAL